MLEVCTTAVEVFCVYAQKDKSWLKKLEKHLSMLQRQGLISLWHDRKLVAGSDWHRELDAHLERAAIILLLVSADFLASDYCYSVEMQRALAHHDAHEARVIPILLRPCDWQSAPFARLNALPANAKPLTRWSDRDEALTEVATGIRLALEDLSLLFASLPRSGQPMLWNIPFARNPFFSGREDELTHLHTQLQQSNTAAIGQMQSISGLGGVGKTQLAVEYAYRHRQDYQSIFWARADSLEMLNASYSEIANLLNLPEKEAREQELVVQAVRTWLETHSSWLLVLDNLDEPSMLFPLDEHGLPRQSSPFLPTIPGGHLLLTTRAADLSALSLGLAHPLVVKTFTPEQGARLLLQRANLLAPNTDLTRAASQDLALATQLSRELGSLPLALDQAGAYLSATKASLAAYLHMYQQRHADLLKQHRGRDYPHSVATTWTLSFERVEARNPAAADLLRFCAFLAPDDIPEEILTEGADELGIILASIAADPLQFNEAIESLRAYSLIARDPQAQTLIVHRLVQTVLRDSLPVEVQQQWMQRAVHAINIAFPSPAFENWPTCEQLLPHVLICANWVEQAPVETLEAARLLNQTGWYLIERGQYAYKEVEKLQKRALAIYEQRLGAESLQTASSMNHLAYLYTKQGKYAEAESLYQRALAIREKNLGPEHPETINSLNNLASLYQSQGKYEKAEPLYRRALVIREKTEDTFMARSLNNLADLSEAQGKYSEAELLYQRALLIHRKLESQHPDTAKTLGNLARLYVKQGKYAAAEPLYQHALAACEQLLGPEHPDTGTCINNLAELYRDQGRYADAEPLYQKALAIYEQQRGGQHPYTATILNNLALLYDVQEKHTEAESLLRRALAICEQQLGPEHPDTASSLNNLALLYDDQGKYSEAEPLLRRALIIREKHLGWAHPETASSLNNLALLCHNQGKHTEAEQLYRQALTIYDRLLGLEHLETASCLNNLAVLCASQRRFAEAETLHQRSLTICEQQLGSGHPETAGCLNNLAALYASQGRYPEAEPLLRRVLAIWEQTLGEEHPKTRRGRENYAELLRRMGRE